MTTIPEVRDRLLFIARNYNSADYSQELIQLADALHRRPPVRKAQKKTFMTEAKRMAIFEYANSHPEASYMEIGTALNINPGRISETLAGVRE